MVQPKISVIVPIYKVEPYLRNCLDSIVNQTYRNLEIILVDDGSSDSTGDICDTYQQQYGNLIKVEHCRHRGVSQRRLTGIRRASGEYVVFVDADDWVENDYIVSMLSCMESADIVAAGISRELSDEKESNSSSIDSDDGSGRMRRKGRGGFFLADPEPGAGGFVHACAGGGVCRGA